MVQTLFQNKDNLAQGSLSNCNQNF